MHRTTLSLDWMHQDDMYHRPSHRRHAVCTRQPPPPHVEEQIIMLVQLFIHLSIIVSCCALQIMTNSKKKLLGTGGPWASIVFAAPVRQCPRLQARLVAACAIILSGPWLLCSAGYMCPPHKLGPFDISPTTPMPGVIRDSFVFGSTSIAQRIFF